MIQEQFSHIVDYCVIAAHSIGLPNPVVRLCTCQRSFYNEYCRKYCFSEGPLEARTSRRSCETGQYHYKTIFWLLFSFGWESHLLHVHKWKAIRSRSCKLPSQLRKRQTQKFAKSEHVKQNKPSTCQLEKTVSFTVVLLSHGYQAAGSVH